MQDKGTEGHLLGVSGNHIDVLAHFLAVGRTMGQPTEDRNIQTRLAHRHQHTSVHPTALQTPALGVNQSAYALVPDGTSRQ